MISLFGIRSSERYPPPKPKVGHHRFLVEKRDDLRLLTVQELEKAFQIAYVPHLDFAKVSIFRRLANKTARFRKKGYLDDEQLWLGAFFEKEILEAPPPPIRLRWIDELVGWGVFAERDLQPLEYIGEYAGKVRRKKRSDSKNSYCFEMSLAPGERTPFTIDALDQGSISRFINHSSAPNLTSALATVRDLSHVVLFVTKFIPKGEQLCYDYGADYWKKRNRPLNLT